MHGVFFSDPQKMFFVQLQVPPVGTLAGACSPYWQNAAHSTTMKNEFNKLKNKTILFNLPKTGSTIKQFKKKMVKLTEYEV